MSERKLSPETEYLMQQPYISGEDVTARAKAGAENNGPSKVVDAVASGSPPGLFNLYVRHTDGRYKKLTGYPMSHAECCVMKSKFSEWTQARTLLVKETDTL